MSSHNKTRSSSVGAGASTFIPSEPRATRVEFDADSLILRLADGRSLSVPLVWLPRLLAASPEARSAWELVDGGEEIRWADLDEDLSVEGLLRP